MTFAEDVYNPAERGEDGMAVLIASAGDVVSQSKLEEIAKAGYDGVMVYLFYRLVTIKF